MIRHRVALAPHEEPEHVAARRALKTLVRFKLDVCRQNYSRSESITTALAAVQPIAEFLTAVVGSAEALELLEEYVAALRDKTDRRVAGRGKGGQA